MRYKINYFMNGGTLYFDNSINDIFIVENASLKDIENIFESLDNILNQWWTSKIYTETHDV